MRSPDRLNCDNAERPPCDKDGRITLKLNYGKIPKLEGENSLRPLKIVRRVGLARLPSEPDSVGIDPSDQNRRSENRIRKTPHLRNDRALPVT
jgi:hypothetical protein